jgi:hypothetical protein
VIHFAPIGPNSPKNVCIINNHSLLNADTKLIELILRGFSSLFQGLTAKNAGESFAYWTIIRPNHPGLNKERKYYK